MKILLIGPYGIGNTILALPTMKLLREKFPDAQIDILTLLKTVYNMINDIPDFKIFDNVYFLDKKNLIKTFCTILKLHFKKYDYSFLLFPSAKIYYNILNFLIFAKKRVGALYPDINFRRGSFLNNVNIKVIEGIHDTFQNINLLSIFNVDYKKINIKENKSLLTIKKKKKIIGFHTGCKKEDYYRKWNIINYLILIKKILKLTKYNLRLFFGPDEFNDYIFLKNNLEGNKRIEFIYNKPLKELFKKINECFIFVSNDSGLMHIANFLGCYNIVIWGPSDFRRTGPFNRPFKKIYKNLRCRPCSHSYNVKSYKFKCLTNDIRCMKSIEVDEVLKEILKFK